MNEKDKGASLKRGSAPKDQSFALFASGFAVGHRSRPADSAMTDPELNLMDFQGLDKMDVVARISAIERGVLASDARELAIAMKMAPTRFLQLIGAPRTAFTRKNASHGRLSIAQSERAVWLAQQVGLIQTLVSQSGNPLDFDAAAWLGRWLDRPCLVLAKQRSADFISTAEGRQMLALEIQRMQTGAYS